MSTGTCPPQSHPQPPRCLAVLAADTWAVGVQGELCVVCSAGWRSPLPRVPLSSCPAAATWAQLPRGFLEVLPRLAGRTSATLEDSPGPGGPVSLSTSFWDCQLLFATHMWARQTLPFIPSFPVTVQASAGEGRAHPGEWLEVALRVCSRLTERWSPRHTFPLPPLLEGQRKPPPEHCEHAWIKSYGPRLKPFHLLKK